jgi:spermidine/putrescine transport system permease protein
MSAQVSNYKKRHPMGNPWYGLLPVMVYLLLFYVVPVLYLLSTSFRTVEGSGLQFSSTWTLINYQEIFASQSNWVSFIRSLWISTLAVFFSILIAYPVSYTIVFVVPRRFQQVALLLVIAPFWTSFVIRAFAWQLLLAESGPIGILAELFGIMSLDILFTHKATVIGLTVFGTMLMTLNLYSVMENINPNLLAAAADLGARRWRTFLEVILPLTRPGLLLGIILTFIIAFGDFVVPSLLGGGIRILLSQAMVGAMTTHFNIPRAATFAMVMLITILVITLPLLRMARQGLNTEA